MFLHVLIINIFDIYYNDYSIIIKINIDGNIPYSIILFFGYWIVFSIIYSSSFATLNFVKTIEIWFFIIFCWSIRSVFVTRLFIHFKICNIWFTDYFIVIVLIFPFPFGRRSPLCRFFDTFFAFSVFVIFQVSTIVHVLYWHWCRLMFFINIYKIFTKKS